MKTLEIMSTMATESDEGYYSPQAYAATELIQADCACGEPNEATMLNCTLCKTYFHVHCTGIDASLSKEIAKFYCSTCEKQNNISTEWRLKEAGPKRKLDKSLNEYDVEAILGHDDGCQPRKFLVKWKGYSNTENTWEPEQNFQNAYGKLQQYCREVRIALSKIKGFYGAAPGNHENVNINPRAWATIDEILEVTNLWRNHRTYECKIDIVEYKNRLHKRDIIYIVGYMNHCYVVLYFAALKKGYIADGRNTYLEDVEVQKALNCKLKIHLSGAKYSQQTRADHCALSASVIALELKRCYKHQRQPKQLIATKTMLDKATRALNHDPSEVIDDRAPVLRRFKLSCEGCGKSYYAKSRRAINGHEQKCEKRLILIGQVDNGDDQGGSHAAIDLQY